MIEWVVNKGNFIKLFVERLRVIFIILDNMLKSDSKSFFLGIFIFYVEG